MHPSQTEEFLGIDVGAKRIGLARGSMAARLAEPLKTISAETALSEIGRLADHYKTDGIVLGLPRGLDSQETDQTKYVRDWADAAKVVIKLPFYWQDEALTSVGGQAVGGKHGVDAAAAAIILQDFLDTPIDQRVRC